MSSLISEKDYDTYMKKCPEWEVEKGQLTRVWEFDDYREGLEVVNEIAELAEEANHHPDVTLSWCKVTVALSTHSMGGITDMDFSLARRIDDIVD